MPPPIEKYLRRRVELPEKAWGGRQEFFSWLEDGWKTFLDDRVNNEATLVDFSDHVLKQRISPLFQDGIISHCIYEPREPFDRLLEKEPWIRVGVVRENGIESGEEIYGLIGDIHTSLEAQPVDWGKVGRLWSWLSYLKDLGKCRVDDYEELDRTITSGFQRFVIEEYDRLFYRSYNEGPVTIDQVLHYLGGRSGKKKALLCLDGMGYQEWFCIKEFLGQKGLTSERFTERPLYAALPTLTGASRRALYSGIRPNQELPAENKGFIKHIDQHWFGGRGKRKQLFFKAPMQQKMAGAFGEREFFALPDPKTVAQKYNGQHWDYQHRMQDDLIVMY